MCSSPLNPVAQEWKATHRHFTVTLFTVMYPVVCRRGSNASINFRGWARRLLRSEGFNANQWVPADDVIHMLGISGERFVSHIYTVWLCWQSTSGITCTSWCHFTVSCYFIAWRTEKHLWCFSTCYYRKTLRRAVQKFKVKLPLTSGQNCCLLWSWYMQ